MRGVAVSSLLVALVVAGASHARGDSVFVGPREITGQITAETSESIVLRVGAGTITIPRRDVTRVVHEDEVSSLLNEARVLARSSDRAGLECFDRAIALLRGKGANESADAALAERAALTARLSAKEIQYASRTHTPISPVSLGPAARHDFAEERDASPASVERLRALGRTLLNGDALREGSPSYDPSWSRVDLTHFIVFHQLGDRFQNTDLQTYENARDQALSRLGIPESDIVQKQVPLILFRDKRTFVSAGANAWAAGETVPLSSTCRLIATYPGQEDVVLPHEITHALIANGRRQSWAEEGVAMYAEPDDSRERRRISAARLVASGKWMPLGTFLAAATFDHDAPSREISAFYSESCVVFQKLVDATGSVKQALDLAKQIATAGVDAALHDASLSSAEDLDTEIRTKLANP
jgi:hypothetical protein